MTKFERKVLKGLCTWALCENKSIASVTDVDEPTGDKLQLCAHHLDEYDKQLEDELCVD